MGMEDNGTTGNLLWFLPNSGLKLLADHPIHGFHLEYLPTSTVNLFPGDGDCTRTKPAEGLTLGEDFEELAAALEVPRMASSGSGRSKRSR